jgi:hypothetical protein
METQIKQLEESVNSLKQLEESVNSLKIMVKDLITNMPSRDANPHRSERYQPAQRPTETESRSGRPEGNRGHEQGGRGSTTFYRNGGGLRGRQTWAGVAGNSGAQPRFHGDQRAPHQPSFGSESQGSHTRRFDNVPFDTETHALGLLLFNNCQLRQSHRNWRVVPRSIGHRLDRVFADIRPPRVTEEIGNSLKRVKDTCKSQLVDTILSHIEENIELNNKEIAKHTEEKFQEAASWATKRVLDHFRQRVSKEEVIQWISEVRKVFRRRSLEVVIVPQVTISVTTGMEGISQAEENLELSRNLLHTSVNVTATADGEDMPWQSTSHSRSSHKRERPADSSPVETSNTFSALQDLEEAEDTFEEGPYKSKSPKKPRLIRRRQMLEEDIEGARDRYEASPLRGDVAQPNEEPLDTTDEDLFIREPSDVIKDTSASDLSSVLPTAVADTGSMDRIPLPEAIVHREATSEEEVTEHDSESEINQSPGVTRESDEVNEESKEEGDEVVEESQEGVINRDSAEKTETEDDLSSVRLGRERMTSIDDIIIIPDDVEQRPTTDKNRGKEPKLVVKRLSISQSTLNFNSTRAGNSGPADKRSRSKQPVETRNNVPTTNKCDKAQPLFRRPAFGSSQP